MELVGLIMTPCTKHKVVDAPCVEELLEPENVLLLTMITRLVLCEDCSVDIATARSSDDPVTIRSSSNVPQNT
jgi:hypothetical protein